MCTSVSHFVTDAGSLTQTLTTSHTCQSLGAAVWPATGRQAWGQAQAGTYKPPCPPRPLPSQQDPERWCQNQEEASQARAQQGGLYFQGQPTAPPAGTPRRSLHEAACQPASPRPPAQPQVPAPILAPSQLSSRQSAGCRSGMHTVRGWLLTAWAVPKFTPTPQPGTACAGQLPTGPASLAQLPPHPAPQSQQSSPHPSSSGLLSGAVKQLALAGRRGPGGEPEGHPQFEARAPPGGR